MKMSIFLLKPEDTSLQHMIKYGCIYTREKILVPAAFPAELDVVIHHC